MQRCPHPTLITMALPLVAMLAFGACSGEHPAAARASVRQAPGGRRASQLHASLRVAAWAGADVGSLPGVAAGFGVNGAVVLWGQRLEVGFEAWPRGSTAVHGRPGTGGHVALLLASVATCRAVLAGRVELGPCLGLDPGRIQATGFGVSDPGEGASLWLAVRGGALAAWVPGRRLAVTLHVDAVVPLLRPRFVLTNVGPVHQPSAVAGRSMLGVECRF